MPRPCPPLRYSSTIEALTFMIERSLLVPSTFVRYDDWPAFPAAHGPHAGSLLYGQALAHEDITRRYGITWRGPLNNTRAFQVVSIERRTDDLDLYRSPPIGCGT